MNCESESHYCFGPERPLYKTLSAPLDVQLELTTACDNQCLHCYNFWEKSTAPIQQLTKSQVEQVVNDLAQNGVFYLTITGGEPLLNDSSLIACIKGAGRRGLEVSLNTNLASATKDLLYQLQNLGVKRVLTSLISFEEATHDLIAQRQGAHKETIRGIENAQAVGLNVVVNMVVTRLNLEQVYQTGYFCYQQLGVQHFCATKASCSLSNRQWMAEYGLSRTETQQMLESLLRLRDEDGVLIDTLEPIPHCFLGDLNRFSPLSKRRCVAALTTCTIGADGEIRPCSHADKSYGNIFRSGLKEAWSQMAEWRSGELIPASCRECKHLAACGGGCRVAAAYTHEGDFRTEDPFIGDPSSVVPLGPSFSKSFPPDFLRLPFQLVPGVKFRSEDFGGIIDNSDRYPLFVNSITFELITRLRGKTFVLENLASQENIQAEEIGQFFYQLWQNKMIRATE